MTNATIIKMKAKGHSNSEIGIVVSLHECNVGRRLKNI